MKSLNKYKAAPGKAQTIYKARFSHIRTRISLSKIVIFVLSTSNIT